VCQDSEVPAPSGRKEGRGMRKRSAADQDKGTRVALLSWIDREQVEEAISPGFPVGPLHQGSRRK